MSFKSVCGPMTSLMTSAFCSISLVAVFLGDTHTKSARDTSQSCAPLVSICTMCPADFNTLISAGRSCSAGSPPVITTVLQGNLASSTKIWSPLRGLPGAKAYLVSQNSHPMLHPERRKNTAGIPAWRPSPWIE